MPPTGSPSTQSVVIGSTGIGSLPGADPRAAMSMVFGTGLSTPYLAELPNRGPGADMIGRAASRLVDLPVELQVGRWRLTSRAGMDARRAADFWRWDLDALQVVADGYAGPLKVSLTGPTTLAAGVELSNGNVILTDAGAFRDLQDSQIEGAVTLLAELRERVPGAAPILQLDEPSLPAALAGTIPTASGYSRIPAVRTADATELFAAYVENVGVPVVVHSCAPSPPYAVLHEAGVAAALVDATLIARADYDALGESVDGGLQVALGVLDPVAAPSSADVDRAAARVREIASIVGISGEQVATRVGVSPSCGMSGATDADAAAITRATCAVTRQLSTNPQ